MHHVDTSPPFPKTLASEGAHAQGDDASQAKGCHSIHPVCQVCPDDETDGRSMPQQRVLPPKAKETSNEGGAICPGPDLQQVGCNDSNNNSLLTHTPPIMHYDQLSMPSCLQVFVFAKAEGGMWTCSGFVSLENQV